MSTSAGHVDPATALVPTTAGSLDVDYLERTVGVYFIGYILAMVLYGFTFFQGYMYYSRYPKDNWRTKSFVAFIVVLDTVISGVLSETLYYYIVELFLFTRGVELATTTFCVQFQLSMVAVFLTQIFYAWCIWKNSRSAAMSGATGFLATVSLVFGTSTTVQLLKDTQFAHMSNNPTKYFAGVAQGLSAASVIVSMIGLSTGPMPDKFKPFKSSFDTLVGYGISYGGACAVLQVGYTFMFVGAPDKHYWIPFHVVVTKFFVISAITYLNSRHSSYSAATGNSTNNTTTITKEEWTTTSGVGVGRGINVTQGSTHVLSTGSVVANGERKINAGVGQTEGDVEEYAMDMKHVIGADDHSTDDIEEKEEEEFRVKSEDYKRWIAE